MTAPLGLPARTYPAAHTDPSTTRPGWRGRASRHLLAAVALATALVTGVAAPSAAHDDLVGTEVVMGGDQATVSGFVLTFSNDIIEVGAEIIASDATGADVTDGTPTIEGRTVTQALTTPLAEGRVSIAWRVVSADGHPITGALALDRAEDGSATLTEISPEELQASAPAAGGNDTAADEASGAQGESTDGGAGEFPIAPAVGIAFGAAVVVTIIIGLVVGARRRAQQFSGPSSK